MTDGTVVRVGYAGKNGHAYRSVGQEMVRRGTHTMDQVSAPEIANYVRANPCRGQRPPRHQPVLRLLPQDRHACPRRRPDRRDGPLDHHACAPSRSTRSSPRSAPRSGSRKDGRRPIRSLMVAQDTGGAIKGMQRADIFYGTGAEAGTPPARSRTAAAWSCFCPSTAPSRCWTTTRPHGPPPPPVARGSRTSGTPSPAPRARCTATSSHLPEPPPRRPNRRPWPTPSRASRPSALGEKHRSPEQRDLAPTLPDLVARPPCAWTRRPTPR